MPSLRYAKEGNDLINAYHHLKQYFKEDVNIERCFDIFRSPEAKNFDDDYESNIVIALILRAAQNDKFVFSIQNNPKIDRAVESVIVNAINDNRFGELADIAYDLRKTEYTRFSPEQKLLSSLLYSFHAQNVFRRYLKKNKNDRPPNAFKYKHALYDFRVEMPVPYSATYFRDPLDVLSGHFYLCGATVTYVNIAYAFLYAYGVLNTGSKGDCDDDFREGIAIAVKQWSLLSEEDRKLLGLPIATFLSSLPDTFQNCKDLQNKVIALKPAIDACRSLAFSVLERSMVFHDCEAWTYSISLLIEMFDTYQGDILGMRGDYLKSLQTDYDILCTIEEVIDSKSFLYPELADCLKECVISDKWADFFRMALYLHHQKGALSEVQLFNSGLSQGLIDLLYPVLFPVQHREAQPNELIFKLTGNESKRELTPSVEAALCCGPNSPAFFGFKVDEKKSASAAPAKFAV